MPFRRLPALLGLAALAALVLRFVAVGPLWLDEALSVAIAKLPLGELDEALRHDGSPPRYYLLLHGWLRVFGDSVVAVRALSGLLSLATIPAAWAFAREVADRRVAWVTALLVTTSPFAIRFASETRMYALVQLLSALGGLALVRYVRTRSARWAVAVAACAGLLTLTHYWALYLVAAVFLLLAARRDWRACAAVAGGGVLFLPWLPSFLYQLVHTGTPWAPRPQPSVLVDVVGEWSGAPPAGRFLFVALLALAALGVVGVPGGASRVELDLRGNPPGRRLAAVVYGTLLLGILAGLVLGSGYAARYSAVVVVPFLVLAAWGTRALADPRVRGGTLLGVALLGVVAAVPGSLTPRTQAGVVAGELRPRLGPRDAVVYCPDQLGPAVSRLLPDGPFAQLVFPTNGRPERVDWVDYEARNEAGDPVAFARDLDVRFADGTIWLVGAGGYRTYGDRCDQLADELRRIRHDNDTVVRSRRRYVPERMSLVQFRP